MSRLWCFNFDAEAELRTSRCGMKVPLPSAEVARARAAAVDTLRRPRDRGGFLAEGDRVWIDGAVPTPGASSEVSAWCPTPHMRSLLAHAGWSPPLAPDVDALIDANARETFADLDPLPGATVVASEAALHEALERRPPARAPRVDRRPAWVLRPSLCGSGRHRILWEGEDEGARRLANAWLVQGPVHVQPFVDIVAEFAVHGRIGRSSGDLRLGRPVQQRTSGGAWRGAELAADDALSADERARLEDAARDVGERLAALGYFGPYGVDAFRWTDAEGRARFQVAADVNARYTMSFGIGAPELL